MDDRLKQRIMTMAMQLAIHKKYFSQMTGILDLIHGLSYAYRAAAVLDEAGLYRRWALAMC